MRAEQDEATALLDGLDLDALLAALARGRGYETALRDPPGRRGWSDVNAASLNFLQLDQRIDRLARLLSINRGQPGASVAILAPLGPEAIVSVLACLRAGLSPVMLPLHGNEIELLRLVEASGAVMALGVSRIGPLRPLLILRNLAMRAFSTRFVGGFGPDVPEGVAPLDMMHAMIAGRMGSHFARRISDWYLHTGVAEPGAPQRGSAPERHGTHHPALLTILEKMEATVEQPLDRRAMARLAGISIRHLDRLFAEHLPTGFLETYRNIRLDHAKKLLEQSPLTTAEIAFATGFSSAGHFSRAFKTRFAMTPSGFRMRGFTVGED